MSDDGATIDGGFGIDRLTALLSLERVARLLPRAAAHRPEARYASLPDGSAVTVGELHARVEALAATLRSHGVGEGSRVAVGLVNSLEHVAVIFALAALGAVWLPVNPRLRGLPLSHLLSDARPTHLLGEGGDIRRELEASLAAVDPAASLQSLGRWGADPAHEIERVRYPEGAEALPQPADLRAIMYTSGTTGAPKGVMVTDALFLAAAAGCLRVTECRAGDVLYLWEPLFHIGGAQMVLQPLIADVALALGPGFDRRTFWRDVAASGATHIHYLGGVLQMLLKEPPSPAERAHAVRVGWGAGATPEVWGDIERRFGIRLHECYGATETSSFVSVNTGGAEQGIGHPLPWFEVRVDELPGVIGGELLVRPRIAGLVTPGYWCRPEATAAARADGWWRTGDLVELAADGHLRFLGRVADGLRVRGENLSGWQIEAAFDQHPAIAKSAVVGIASELGDQELLLFVQPAEGAALDLAELRSWASERLPSLYLPRYVKLVDAFELTPSRRIAKGALDRGEQGRIDFHAAAGARDAARSETR